jgi:hypothetical protein
VPAMSKQVRCRDCGFLARAALDQYQTRPEIHEEVSVIARREMAAGTFSSPSDVLHCAKGGWFDPPGELGNVNKARACPDFTRYKPGYSPDSHQALIKETNKRRIQFILLLALIAVFLAIVLGITIKIL